jgi:hypothetical protein
MGRLVVHDDDVAGIEFGEEDRLDIGAEHIPICGAVDDHRRREAAKPQSGGKRRRLDAAHPLRAPMAVRDGSAARAVRAHKGAPS